MASIKRQRLGAKSSVLKNGLKSEKQKQNEALRTLHFVRTDQHSLLWNRAEKNRLCSSGKQ
jgi:hypothetical protein